MSLKRILCLFGHLWPRDEEGHLKWEYISSTSCEQIRTCIRCGKSETRIEHQRWSDWKYISDGLCEQKETCSRCGKLKSSNTRIEHHWSKWEYVSGDGGSHCIEKRTCSRCGSSLESKAEHKWSEWEYLRDGSCAKTRGCKRCGYSESGTFHKFKWEYVKKDSCEMIYSCERCGHRDNESLTPRIDHLWEWKGTRNESNLCPPRTCKRCGLVEEERKHNWSDWTYLDGDYHERNCKRCGTSEKESHFYNQTKSLGAYSQGGQEWEEWECVCSGCGNTSTQSVP
jgi:hypothetical protein